MRKYLRCTHVLRGQRPARTVVHMRTLPNASRGEELDTETELCGGCTGAVCDALMYAEGPAEDAPI